VYSTFLFLLTNIFIYEPGKEIMVDFPDLNGSGIARCFEISA
jgi:hypothetical protein